MKSVVQSPFFYYYVQGNREQGNEWVSTVCIMTKTRCSWVGTGAQYRKCGQGAEFSLSHQLLHLPCRGVRPDKEQEVRGDSTQSVPDMNVPINKGHAMAQYQKR